MDSRIGLDYIVENKEYTTKLGSALDTTSIQVKRQVFELLSALCVYNAEGYNRALEALDHYKDFQSSRYRFSVVVEELRQAKANEYRTVLLAFINCLVISTPQLKDRNRLRNEFIGLKLLEIIRDLKTSSKDPDLKVQLDVFEEQRESDEAQTAGPHDVDLSCHLDVFYTVYNRVQDTPQEIPFLSILQHLLRIDPKEPVSDIIWDTAETLVHRATLMESKEDSARLLRAPSQHKSLHRLKSMDGGLRAEYRKHSFETQTCPNCANAANPPPPPPPPLIGGGPPPPPPPGGGPPPPPPPGGAPPPPPPGSFGPPKPPQPEMNLPQLDTPKPKNKMKTLAWNKLPVNKIFGKNNIWTKIGKSFEKEKESPIDFRDMEQLFCLVAPKAPEAEKKGETGNKQASNKASEINLLDGKRSLNINIFLKQFRSSNEDIIEMVVTGDFQGFEPEKLRGLMKILPEQDEIEMLKSWEGDTKKLGNAERFILQLISVKNYRLRVESMLLKAEFEANMSFLEPSIEAMLTAGEELMNNPKLQNLLYMVLVAGNFLNSGGYAGNAAGMKISSLHKLSDIRSNKPGMNLLHYVAGQVEQTQPELLTIVDDLAVLEEASRTSIEVLNGDINKLDGQIRKISTQMKSSNTEPDVASQMNEFLPYASKELECLKNAMEDLTKIQGELAEFFCEDSKSFRLEECYKAFHQFNNNFKKAVVDNEKRQEQERTAEQRRLQRETEQAKRRSGSFQGGAKDEEKEDGGDEVVMNNLMHDIKEGFIQRRLPDGGFKQQYSPMVMRKFKKSLDSQLSQTSTVSGVSVASKDSEDENHTPYGTPKTNRRGRGGSFSGPTNAELLNGDVPNSPGLRRRRSRVPSEEDDKLINFLVTGGHDGSRERNISIGNIAEQQTYGSLDRGLLRRSRGRRRPELLNAEVNGDRDRSAPQPSVEDAKPEDPRTKEIKKRVESWLKESEEDVSKADEYLDKKKEKKVVRGSNSDLRNGKGLGTLHEDKPLDAKTIVSKTDVISAMEVIEGASLKEKTSRKRTPPSNDDMKKKALIRSLGRRPSEDKIALYVRKPSNETSNSPQINKNDAPKANGDVKLRDKKPPIDDSKKNQFLQDMARRSLEVPTDFLDKIDEEKKAVSDNRTALDDGISSTKKYPFNRTTTPNTLREHLKETLAKNLGSSTDLAETIHAIKDDEILDTFNIDSENIETPPIQRRAFRHKSFRMPDQDDDNESDIGSDFSGRRKNHKFRTITGDGRPLGDRELIIKKKKASNNDLSTEGRKATTDLEDELGTGLFDRFSTARKTLTRGSMRKKKDEDTQSLHESQDKKSDGWKSKLASRFRKSNADQYDLEEAERINGLHSKEEPILRSMTSDYLGQQTPMTEPTRRKPLNIDDGPTKKADLKGSTTSLSARSNRRERTKSRIEADQVQQAKSNGRKSSYIMPGDYDSELVDGKYVTSVPIINVEQAEDPISGNIRPGHSLKDLKKPVTRKNSLIERLSRSASAKEPRGATGSNVFDRLSTGRSASRSNLNGSRPSVASEVRSSTSSLTARGTPSRAASLPPDKPRGTLTKIRDLSKDIKKNLRKGKEEGPSSTTIVKPRNSNGLFSDRERKPMSNLNGGSHPSINSSTRSLHKSTLLGTNSPKSTRRSTSTINDRKKVRPSNVNIKGSNSTSSLRSPTSPTSPVPKNGINNRPTSSKENLSRSSSSASRSSVTNSMSRNGSLRTGVASPTNTSNSNLRSSSLIQNNNHTLPKVRTTITNHVPSYMKPTTARTKKVLGTATLSDPQTLRKNSVNKITTTSRVTPVGPRPTRR